MLGKQLLMQVINLLMFIVSIIIIVKHENGFHHYYYRVNEFTGRSRANISTNEAGGPFGSIRNQIRLN